MSEVPVLTTDISVDYPAQDGVLSGVQMEVRSGEILGLVGQSGSGKSTLSLAIMGLLGMKGGKVRGSVQLNGRELVGMPQHELRAVRGKQVGLISQSAMTALNPALKIGTQLKEAWGAHSREDGTEKVAEALRSVSLPDDRDFLRRYPSEISVGQGQRVVIAMGVLHRPGLLIADEPTSALDMITHSEVLALFSKLNHELRTAILFISHDLLSVASICHRVAILNKGKIVECAETTEIFQNPKDEYTRKLVAAIPAMSKANKV